MYMLCVCIYTEKYVNKKYIRKLLNQKDVHHFKKLY